MAGRLDKPDGDSEAPHVVLSPLGRMVEQELTESIQRYYYRKADEGITVVECKTMNCITQAVCRLRDEWWKQNIAS
jgi:hypothetical protein